MSLDIPGLNAVVATGTTAVRQSTNSLHPCLKINAILLNIYMDGKHKMIKIFWNTRYRRTKGIDILATSCEYSSKPSFELRIELYPLGIDINYIINNIESSLNIDLAQMSWMWRSSIAWWSKRKYRIWWWWCIGRMQNIGSPDKRERYWAFEFCPIRIHYNRKKLDPLIFQVTPDFSVRLKPHKHTGK